MLKYIPIIRTTITLSKAARKSALHETVITALFSTTPIWLFPIIFGVFTTSSVSELFRNVLSKGELYLFSAALVGPIIYWILGENLYLPRSGSEDDSNNKSAQMIGDLRRKFPDAISFIFCLFCIAVISSFVILLLHTEELQPWALDLDNKTINFVGLGMFIFSNFLLFSALATKYDLNDPGNSMREKTHNFAQDFQEFIRNR